MELINENKLNESIIKDLSRSEPKWLKEHRLNAFAKFKELTIPEFRYGLSIVLRPDNLEIIEDEFLESLKNPVDIEINNVEGVEIFDFSKDYDTIKKYINQLIKYDHDKFISFHNAFFNKGLFIRVPKNTEIETPLILNKILKQKYSFEYIIIVAEPNSKIKILDSSTSEENQLFRSKVVEIFLQENSKVTYMDMQNFNNKIFNINNKKADVSRDAELNWIECILGSHLTKVDTLTNLNGEGATSNNYGVFFGNQKEQFDISTSAIHNAPRTFSDMMIKGALDNNAKNVYQGLVHITKNAPFSIGYQKEDTLLLGPGAEADPIPKLLIDNNNVQCSHGATIGEIDKEKLFYMMSRGLNEKEAKEEFVKGFFNPIFDKIKEKTVQENLKKIIEERLKL